MVVGHSFRDGFNLPAHEAGLRAEGRTSVLREGRSNRTVARGGLLGLATELEAVFLHGPPGLGTGPSRCTSRSAATTLAWYTSGGLVAGVVYGYLPSGGTTG